MRRRLRGSLLQKHCLQQVSRLDLARAWLPAQPLPAGLSESPSLAHNLPPLSQGDAPLVDLPLGRVFAACDLLPGRARRHLCVDPARLESSHVVKRDEMRAADVANDLVLGVGRVLVAINQDHLKLVVLAQNLEHRLINLGERDIALVVELVMLALLLVWNLMRLQVLVDRDSAAENASNRVLFEKLAGVVPSLLEDLHRVEHAVTATGLERLGDAE
eukprot:Amastigsp_a841170_55.p2 type:complete len:217 gc:universal Amastigsp_a841170_55:932-282(-)